MLYGILIDRQSRRNDVSSGYSTVYELLRSPDSGTDYLCFTQETVVRVDLHDVADILFAVLSVGFLPSDER